VRGIPDDVYFLMPAYGQGTVWFSDRAPAEGKMNICAEDDKLWFLDQDGQELVASDIGTVTRVQIDSALFIRNGGLFYRVYQETGNIGIAVRRNLRILRDAKRAAYGGYSQTSSVREYTTLHTDGGSYRLDQTTDHPFEVSENYYIYKEGTLHPFKKRNLRKEFPDRREDIDAYLKAGNPLPEALPDIKAFVSRLATGETLVPPADE